MGDAEELHHLFSVDDLGAFGHLEVLDRAEKIRLQPLQDRPFVGKVLGLFILQPSTRTRVGFHSAMARLGGTAIEITDTKLQPGMGMAESFTDTVRSISAYCDALVLRHHSLNEVRAAIDVSDVPIINGLSFQIRAYNAESPSNQKRDSGHSSLPPGPVAEVLVQEGFAYGRPS